MPESRGICGNGRRHAYLVTCAEPDATPFLTTLPKDIQEHAVLVSTANVVRAAEQHTSIPTTYVIGGLSTFGEARRLLAQPDTHVTVVIGPDPWGPIHGKGFVRARVVAPLVVPHAPVDVIELEAGGEAGRVRRGVERAVFSRWMLSREVALLAEYLLWNPVERQGSRISEMRGRSTFPLRMLRPLLVPVRVALTLAVVLPYVAASELRARRSSPTDDRSDEMA